MTLRTALHSGDLAVLPGPGLTYSQCLRVTEHSLQTLAGITRGLVGRGQTCGYLKFNITAVHEKEESVNLKTKLVHVTCKK